MKTFSVLQALCKGNPLVTSGFPSQRSVMHSFYVFFDLCLNKQLSDLRCHCAHYDVTVICSQAVTRTSADFLLIGPSRTNFREILIKYFYFPLRKFENVVCWMVVILSWPSSVTSSGPIVLMNWIMSGDLCIVWINLNLNHWPLGDLNEILVK